MGTGDMDSEVKPRATDGAICLWIWKVEGSDIEIEHHGAQEIFLAAQPRPHTRSRRGSGRS